MSPCHRVKFYNSVECKLWNPPQCWPGAHTVWRGAVLRHACHGACAWRVTSVTRQTLTSGVVTRAPGGELPTRSMMAPMSLMSWHPSLMSRMMSRDGSDLLRGASWTDWDELVSAPAPAACSESLSWLLLLHPVLVFTAYQRKTRRPWFDVLIGYNSLQKATRIKSK